MATTTYNASLTNSFHKDGSGAANSASWLSGLKTGRYWGYDQWVDLPPPAPDGDGYYVHVDGSYGNRFGFVWFDMDSVRTAMTNQDISSVKLNLRRTDTAGYSPSRAVNGTADKYLYVYGLTMAQSQSGGTLPGDSNGVSESYLTSNFITYGSAIARSSSIEVTIDATTFRTWLDTDSITGFMLVDGDDTGAAAGYVDGDGVNGRASSSVSGEYNGSTYGYMTFAEYDDATYKPTLQIVHTPSAPDEPVLDDIGTITDRTYTFDWSDVTNVEPASEMYYEYNLSFDDGSSWGTTYTTAQGVSEATVPISTVLGLNTTQYYYNEDGKFRVRAKSSGGLYSDWVESDVYTIDYRIVPSAPANLTINTSPPYYEGDSISMTVQNPATYNGHDSTGANNQGVYEVRLNDGTLLITLPAVDIDASGVTFSYTIGDICGDDDLSTTIKARVTDTEGQISPYITGVAFDVKKYQPPVFTITNIDRNSTTATVYFTVTDTGYGSSDQTSSKIYRVRYSTDGGSSYATATLGTWSSLSNSFSITGLSEDSTYDFKCYVQNYDTAGTSAGQNSAVVSQTIYKYYPVFYAWEDTVTGKSGVSVRSLHVGSDFTIEPDAGDMIAEGNMNAYGGVARLYADEGSNALLHLYEYRAASSGYVQKSIVYWNTVNASFTIRVYNDAGTSFNDLILNEDGTFTWDGSAVGVNREADSMLRIPMPGGAQLGGQGGSVTGYIKIALPRFRSTAMVRFTVDLFFYTEGKSATFQIAGYEYSGGWTRTTATMESESGAYTVKFGDDGSKSCLTIEITGSGGSSNWSYPCVAVRDLFVHFGDTTMANWQDGWDVSITTTALSTINRTVVL